MTKVIVYFVRPSRTHIRFLSKSMPLMILKGHYTLSFRKTCIFGVYHEYTNTIIGKNAGE